VLDMAHADDSIRIVAGGTADDSIGYFVRPTVMVGADPEHEIFSTEYFGPLLSVYVYDDADYDRVLRGVEGVSRYALTGSIIARDRAAIAEAAGVLRFAAGNFYVNDKPTGAVVGQQPFGGGRASGTNDKAGSMWNLIRWTSPRTIKETFVPAADYRYPFMAEE
jgi:1-pyrroline-5-carboxylate dehydrogenase